MSVKQEEILENSPLAIVISDQHDRISWCNQLFLDQTSLTNEVVLGSLYCSLPLEAIDQQTHLVQLFTQDSNEEVIFQYWQAACTSSENSKIHYFVRERSHADKSVAHKLKSMRLPKRASWIEFLDYEVSRSRRYDNPLSILKLHLLVLNKSESIDLTNVQQTIRSTLMEELRWADMIGSTDLGSYLMILPETPLEMVNLLQTKLIAALNQKLVKPLENIEYRLVFADACWQKNDDSQRLLNRARMKLVEQLEKLIG